MTDADKLDYAIRFLRRSKTLAEITTLADLVGAALLKGETKVAITSTQMEGGGGSGQIEFEALVTGKACEALLADAEAQGITEGSANIPATARSISHTVVFGGYC